MDLTKIKHIHFTGIKGVAMTAVALCLKSAGVYITGSDTPEIFVTDEVLKDADINWRVGFGPQNLEPKPDLLITTAAHGGLNNPEVVEAKARGINVITYAEALALLASDKKLISVCGVGGKGSTSSMIATILELSGRSPSYAIGMGSIFPIGQSGKYIRNSEYFICEADEYAISPGVNNNPKFSLLNPFITVVTNIEHDHPDIYPTFADTLKVYDEFFARIPGNGVLIANSDNKNTKEAVKKYTGKLVTFGFKGNPDWKISKLVFSEGQTNFVLSGENQTFKLSLHVPGEFNVLNAVGAFIATKQVGLDPDIIIKNIAMYQGARRRFERMGKVNGVIYFDDYAHHPSEIVEAIKAAKAWYPKNRIVALFQPHTYSRTKSLFSEFSTAFKVANVVGLMNIYASARESIDDSISSSMLVESIKKNQKEAFYLDNFENTIKWLKDNTLPGDVVITMGAGDIFHLYNDLPLEGNG